MSEKFTSIEVVGGLHIGEWGHVSYAEAIAQLEKYARSQLAAAEHTLRTIKAGQVRVFHQLGPLAARNRREVKP